MSCFKAPQPFSRTPVTPKEDAHANDHDKQSKETPAKERADDLKHTITMSIIQKLQRMDIDQLREVLNAATKVIEGRK